MAVFNDKTRPIVAQVKDQMEKTPANESTRLPFDFYFWPIWRIFSSRGRVQSV